MGRQDSVALVTASVDDLHGRIEAACAGALAGEAAAGTAAGAADLIGVAESAAACGGFVEEDLRQRGLERQSRSGGPGLLLRALPFGMLTPLDRPRLRRDAYRCVALAGADEGTAIASVAAAILVADLMRFDVATSLIRVRQSLLEDAPMALLARLAPLADGSPADAADSGAVLQQAITALAVAESVQQAVASAVGAHPVAAGLAGALTGAHLGAAGLDGIDVESLPHADRALPIARRLAERADAALANIG